MQLHSLRRAEQQHPINPVDDWTDWCRSCPLLRVKRTSPGKPAMSAFDRKFYVNQSRRLDRPVFPSNECLSFNSCSAKEFASRRDFDLHRVGNVFPVLHFVGMPDFGVNKRAGPGEYCFDMTSNRCMHACRWLPTCGGGRRGSLVRRDQGWRVLGLPISLVGRLLA